ncbi:hypothetical protein D3C78_1059030 [compost metagenome]
MLQVIQCQALDLSLALGRALADASVGQQDRQQYQVGQDQYHDTDGRGNRQVLDYRDIDDHQHRKTHCVGDQRHYPCEEQAAKGETRRDQLVGTTPDVLHDAVHLLRAMAKANGEHQKGHQDRIGVQLIAQCR